MQCFQTMKYVDEYAFRPDYPNELYTTIMEYLGEKAQQNSATGKYSLAIDVACGTGNSTFPLLKYFDKVVGIDQSDVMLEGAKEKPWSKDVEFCKGFAEDLPAEDSSASLVTIGTGLHWLKDLDKFYQEVDRVLVPGGVVAAYCYSLANSEVSNHPNSAELSKLLTELLLVPINKPYTEETVKIALRHYRDDCCQIPYVDRQRCDPIVIEVETTLGGLLNYGKSINFFGVMEKEEPEWTLDWFNGLKKRMLEACGTDDLNYPVTKKIKFFMIMGRKPTELTNGNL